ncbi:MAG: hypothetical protein H7336_07910 [Bacteriovorax sp.]|nr:hypothetical protein [Bacteriovorax sp.]
MKIIIFSALMSLSSLVFSQELTFNGPWYVTFPISDEQGIGTLNLESNDHLGLPLTMEQKVDGQTIGYFLTAAFKK